MEQIKCKKCGAILPVTFAFCPACGRQTVDPPKSNRRRPKGSGSVYKRGDHRSKPWEVRLNKKTVGYFPTLQDAENFLTEHRAADPQTLALNVAQIYNRVLQSQAFKSLAVGSQKNLKGSWLKFAELENKKMRDIKTTDFQNVIDKACENGCGRDGCAKIKSLASMLCQNAMLDDIIRRDYSEGAELPERVEYVKRRDFTEDEIITLFYNDQDRTARIILIMIYTALRLGELFNIEKTSVNLASGYMTAGGKTEAGTNRIIPIKDEIYPYIKDFMEESGSYLIGTGSGKHMHESNFRNRDFYPLLDKLGFDYKDENGKNVLTPHRTRHTYISESIIAGVKPEVLKLVVGHANYSTSVNTYGKDIRLDIIKAETKKSF